MKEFGSNLSDYLVELSEKYGENDAYQWLEGDVIRHRSFKQLEADSRRTASWLHGEFPKGTHIALLGETSYAWITAYFGIMISGNVSVPMDAKLDADTLISRLTVADVKAIILSDRYSYLSDKLIAGSIRVIRMDTTAELAAGEDASFSTDVDADGLGQIMFTSGTTGTGKGVMLSHRNIMAVTHGSVSLCKPGERLLSVLPIHHCFELFYTQLSYLLQGATVCVNDALENIIANMNRFKIHILITVPMLANRFAALIVRKEPEMTAQQIRGLFGGCFCLIGIGGAAARPDVIKTMHRIGVDVFSGYGLTEGTGGCIVNPIDSIRYESIGLPFIKGLEVKIIDGEICLKGPTVMLGYYKDPEESRKALHDGYLHTGDLGSIDDDGYIYISGRVNNMIVTANGENVYPEEIEAYIKEIPGVIEVVVFDDKNKLCAGIQVVPNEDEENIRKQISEINKRMPSYKAVAAVLFRTEPFPVTTSMKVVRKQAIKQLKDVISKETAAAGGSTGADAEANMEIAHIAEVFARVLSLDSFPLGGNFFAEGGDSLAAIEAASELSAAYPDIRSNDLYINPTPESLYRRFRMADGADEIVKIEGINELISASAPIEKGLGHVFMTGAGGYLGNHVLAELLKKGYKVTCLLRSAEKFRRACAFYFPDTDFSSVEIVPGDITLERMGLPEEEYAALAKKIDTVFHLAADVRHTAPEEQQYLVNVEGTKNVLAFALAANATMFHTSTFAVAGFKTDRVLTENVLDIGQQIDANVYVKTKYLAEEQVLLARKQGLRTCIMRMGYLTPRRDGCFQMNESENGLAAQLRAFKKLGVYPKELHALCYDFSGVDDSAKAYVLLAENAQKESIWHVINPNRRTLEMLGVAKCVPQEVFARCVLQNSADRDVIILTMYLRMLMNGMNGNVDVTATVTRLSELGFEWRESDTSII